MRAGERGVGRGKWGEGTGERGGGKREVGRGGWRKGREGRGVRERESDEKMPSYCKVRLNNCRLKCNEERPRPVGGGCENTC